MTRFVLVTVLLTVASLAMAQAVVTSSGQATAAGTAITPAPVSPPLLIAPQVHLGAPAPTMGATSSTMGNAAGAVSSTSQISTPPSVTTIVPQVSMGQGVVYQVPVPVTTVAPATPVIVVAPAASGNAPGRTVALFDGGVQNPGPWSPSTGVGSPGLAEYARARQQTGGTHARTYTNQDVERMNHGGSATGGMTGAAVNAGNASYPANNGVITNQPAVAQPAGANPPQAQPQAPAMPVTSPPAEPGAKPSAGQPSTPPPSDIAQASVPPSPADQQAQPAQQPSQQQPSGRDQLPRSGTVLPIMGLVGLLAVTAGLLSR